MTTKHLNTGPTYKELQNKLPKPRLPCTIGISCVKGECPLGFMEEDVWLVDRQGSANFPLCQDAIDALANVLERIDTGKDFDSRAQCKCRYVECQVTFVVHAPDSLRFVHDDKL